MIRVQNLVKQFGARRAVNDVSFHVAAGEVLGFLGPNGAGKTTTMRMITGFLAPTSGAAVVNGFNVAEQPVAARSCIGYLPENAPLYGDMTVEGFLRFIAEMRGFAGAERNARADAAIEKSFLAPVRRQAIDTLSRGYRQRTCFAQAILHDPPVLILDEPTEGLDPNQKQVVRNLIRHMSRDKVIIFSTHILEEVEAVCSRAIIISGGAIVADAAPAQLKQRSALYNSVTARMAAPAAEALAAARALPGVQRAETVDTAAGEVTLRLFPQSGRLIAPDLLELARMKKWTVRDLRTEDGRLDEVFRTLTTTADVGVAAAREES